MAKVQISNKYNIEDQYFEKFGLPMIMCNSHQNSVCEFININNLNQNKLACAQCIIKDKLNYQFLISIKDIFSKNPSQIIQNWPPMQDLSIYEQLMNNNIQVSKKNLSIEQINRYFDKLKVDILNTIENHQNKILVHINSIEENRKRLVDEYNEISRKDEIKNEFLKNLDNQSLLEQYLKQLIQTQQTLSNHNQSNIQNTLQLFTKYEQQISHDYIQMIFEQFLIDLKSIDILNPLQEQEKQFQFKILDKKNIQVKENNQSFNVIQVLEKNEGKNEGNNGINEKDLLQSLQIIKSNYGKPDQISFKKIENNYFLIERNSEFGWSQVILDEELIGEKKYQIQINVKSQNNQIFLGLLPISQKNQAGWDSKLSLYLNQSGKGINKIENGKHISELGKDVSQISFQICLKEEILRCICVADKIKNINSLHDWKKLKPNHKYYFFVALGGQQQLQIKQFKVVKQFEQW